MPTVSKTGKNNYEIQITLDRDENNKRIRKTTVYHSPNCLSEESQKILKEKFVTEFESLVKQEYEKSKTIKPTQTSSKTFKQVSQRWLIYMSGFINYGTITQESIKSYKYKLEKLSALFNITPIQDITIDVIKNEFCTLKAQYSKNYIKEVLRIVKRVCAYGMPIEIYKNSGIENLRYKNIPDTISAPSNCAKTESTKPHKESADSSINELQKILQDFSKSLERIFANGK